MLTGVAAACLLASTVGVARFTRWAIRTRLLDVPNHRSSHSTPTPRGAGAVIVTVVAAATVWADWMDLIAASWVGVSALVIAVVSWLDDLRPLPSGLRLAVHCCCAAVAVAIISRDDAAPWSGLMLASAALWTVGLTNAYNFMDGTDGLSGAQAVVAGIAVAIASSLTGFGGGVVVGTAIAASSVGFLVHNWPPARVFMGDVGSAFLGFSFAVLTLQVSVRAPAAAIVIAVSVWPFVFDTGLTLVRRLLRGENIFASHRSHLYQRLVIAGRSHRWVALTYASMAALGTVVSYAWAAGLLPWPTLAVVPLMAGAIYALVVASESSARARRA